MRLRRHEFKKEKKKKQLARTRAYMCTASCLPHTRLTACRTACTHTRKHTHRSAVSHLDDSVVDGGVLLLPQHHQGDDDHGCYDDASDHQADDRPLVGTHILGEEDLREVEGRWWSGDPPRHVATTTKPEDIT